MRSAHARAPRAHTLSKLEATIRRTHALAIVPHHPKPPCPHARIPVIFAQRALPPLLFRSLPFSPLLHPIRVATAMRIWQPEEAFL